MKPVNDKERKKNMLFFALAMLATAGIIFSLFTSSKQLGNINIGVKQFSNAGAAHERENQWMKYDEQLHNELNRLQQLDEQYAALLNSSAPGKSLDSLNTIILQEEEDFRRHIDVVDKGSFNKGSDELFSKMIASFRSAIQHRKSIGYLRNAVLLGQNSFTPDKNALLKLQNELMTKTNRIIALESSLSALEKKETETQPQLINSQNAKFADSIKFVAAINVLELKAATLNTANNNLKQEIDKLQKQNESIKSAANNEAALKEKANNLQQRLDAVNADLQLARVDCNLSRIDAKQNISNARQRKQLLNETSSILTDLANSGNVEVKRKVQDKMEQLNQVAANLKE